jgi:hypothetical protein
MKNLLMKLFALSSISAFAVETASFNYTCELDGISRSGSVSIDDQLVVGPVSCMYFGNGPTLCFRFERHIKINDIHLALRTSDQLRSALDTNFISLGNIPYSEGAVSINTIKVGFLKEEELSCVYSNVEWKK